MSILGAVFSSGGLFSPEVLKDVLMEAIPQNDFALLNVPLFVTATDLNSCSSITFSEGILNEVIVGSSVVPAVFDPIPHREFLLVDGGVINDFPVDCLSGKCDKIIGSHVNKLINNKGTLSRLQVLERCFHLANAEKVASQARFCDVLVEPLLTRYNMVEMKYADKIFKIGYQAGMAQKENLLSLIK